MSSDVTNNICIFFKHPSQFFFNKLNYNLKLLGDYTLYFKKSIFIIIFSCIRNEQVQAKI